MKVVGSQNAASFRPEVIRLNGQPLTLVFWADEAQGKVEVAETHWLTGEMIPDTDSPHGFRFLCLQGQVEIASAPETALWTLPEETGEPGQALVVRGSPHPFVDMNIFSGNNFITCTRPDPVTPPLSTTELGDVMAQLAQQHALEQQHALHQVITSLYLEHHYPGIPSLPMPMRLEDEQRTLFWNDAEGAGRLTVTDPSGLELKLDVSQELMRHHDGGTVRDVMVLHLEEAARQLRAMNW